MGPHHPLLMPLLDRSALWYLLSDFRKQGIDTVYLFCTPALRVLIERIKWQLTSLMMHIEFLDSSSELDRLHDLHVDEDPILLIQQPRYIPNLLRDMLLHHQQLQSDCTVHIRKGTRSDFLWNPQSAQLMLPSESLKDNPELIAVDNAQAFLMESDIFETLMDKSDPCDADFIPDLLGVAEYLSGFQSSETAVWHTLDDYLNSQLDWLASRSLLPAGNHRPHALGGHLWVGENCLYPPETEINGAVVLNHRVRIGKGVKIQGPCILGPDVQIDAHCQIERAMIWQKSHIQEHSQICESWLGEQVKIGPHSQIVKNFIGSYADLQLKTPLNPGSVLGAYSQLR